MLSSGATAVGKGHFERAGADILHHFQLAARRARRVRLNPQPAAAIALDLGGELEDACAELTVPAVDGADPQHLRPDGGTGTPDAGKATRRRRGGTRKEIPSSDHATDFSPLRTT
jgi:hypothetical protein